MQQTSRAQLHLSMLWVQGRLWPRSDAERKAAEEAGYKIDQVTLLQRAPAHNMQGLHP